METWFITGCSTGLGRALAKAVLARGWNVVATARAPKTLADIAAQNDRCLALKLDVTDRDDIARAVRNAEARFGAIDVLVNNAGYGYRAAVEEGDERDIRALFDTNFYGLVFMTQAVLPLMRQRRRGWIVNMSSIAGRIGLAGSGFYAATKFAVEGLSGALRQELDPLGIQVMLVEPGAFRTDFAGRSLHQSARTFDDYAETAGLRRKEKSHRGNEPGDPVRGADTAIDTMLSGKAPFRLVLGRDAHQRAVTEIDSQRRELDRWADAAQGADFPSQ